jgi:chemotaxis protein MotA
MDISTLFGLAAFGALIAVGITTGQLPAVFLNWHGLSIVVGGVTAAALLNTPIGLLASAFLSVFDIFGPGPGGRRAESVAAVVSLCEAVRARGIVAFQEADPQAAGGFLASAAGTAAELNNPEIVAEVLQNEISNAFERRNEIVNVFRTMSILAPMFGLLGTLIGIVQVLRVMASPDQVGPAMAVAITTAFYGIAMANGICVPIAGKLRLRYIQEMRVRMMAAEGVVMILKGAVPMIVERRLRSYAD